MALWSKIVINDKPVGHVEALKVAELPPHEARYNWAVEMYGSYKASGTLVHRVGDGADALLLKVLWAAESAKLKPDSTEDGVQFLRGPNWVDL